MSTEVDNKQNPVAAAAAEDKPAAEAPAAPAAAAAAPAVVEDKPAAAAAEGAGGDASKDDAAAVPKEEDAVAADKAAPAEAAAPAKPEPPVKYNVHRQNFEKDIVYLYQFSRTPVLPSLSPYCLKVETWLRLAGLKYEVSAGKFPIRRLLRTEPSGGGWVLAAAEKRFAGWRPFYSENPYAAATAASWAQREREREGFSAVRVKSVTPFENHSLPCTREQESFHAGGGNGRGTNDERRPCDILRMSLCVCVWCLLVGKDPVGMEWVGFL